MANPKEIELYPAVVQLFQKKQRIFFEVPYNKKRVDLVVGDARLRKISAVEVKLQDWKGAIRQAAINQLFAHFSFVAMPAEKVSRLKEWHLNLLRRYGVGLISVGVEEAKISVKPNKNMFQNQERYKHVKKQLNQASNKVSPKPLGEIIYAVSKQARALEILQARPH